MIDPTLIAAQLRTYCTPFAGNVAIASDFETGINFVANLPRPNCFVIPLGDDAADNEDQNATYQVITQRIGVVVQVDASADRLGASAVSNMQPLYIALLSALLNWRFDIVHAPRPMEYGGCGSPILHDRARAFVQFEFRQQIIITQDDGFQVTGVPLEVDLSINVPDTDIEINAVAQTN